MQRRYFKVGDLVKLIRNDKVYNLNTGDIGVVTKAESALYFPKVRFFTGVQKACTQYEIVLLEKENE